MNADTHAKQMLKDARKKLEAMGDNATGLLKILNNVEADRTLSSVDKVRTYRAVCDYLVSRYGPKGTQS